ncbi:MAG: tRNA uridine-5-carboxymethylaminomethyl(34) synthesis GTPase MnmE [Clostridia bacterium]|nr:tRNA uridine-5-carboxymethylaminomethyl(34) synthesis GTPase MnmE [Clostridia bacterium]
MYVKDPFSTVAAISTPRGKGGIAVIRISGEDTVRILEKCFVPKGAALSSRPFRTAVYGDIVSDGAVLDTGICVLYEKGRSFTGETMAELSCHGGVYVTNAVLEAVFAAGAEPAGRGEFTKRAFINGKMSLSEAEAVGKLIDADTASRASLASGAVRGNLSDALGRTAGALLDVMTALYAAIDYPEEDVGTEGEDGIYKVVSDSLEALEKIRKTYKTGRAVADGIKTVICGSPNVGKSSLYNLLLGEERAIVTDVAGTTRDVLEDTVDVGGVTLRLLDTAGIRDTDDKVERIGVGRSREKIAQAELVICVVDSSRPLSGEDVELIEYVNGSGCEVIYVENKSDCRKDGASFEKDDLFIRSAGSVVSMSALTGEGKAQLEALISKLYNEDAIDVSRDAVIWNAAQKAALERACEGLEAAKSALEEQSPLDAVGVVCEEAIANILMIDGRDVSEEIIDGIFSKFCVGK